MSVFLACFYNGSIPGVVVSTQACGLWHSRQPVSGVLYIPFIHSSHNAKDRSLGVGRDNPSTSTNWLMTNHESLSQLDSNGWDSCFYIRDVVIVCRSWLAVVKHQHIQQCWWQLYHVKYSRNVSSWYRFLHSYNVVLRRFAAWWFWNSSTVLLSIYGITIYTHIHGYMTPNWMVRKSGFRRTKVFAQIARALTCFLIL